MFVFYIALFVWPFLAPNWWSLIIGYLIAAAIVSTHQQEEYGGGEHFGWFIGGIVPYGIAVLILSHFYPSFIEKKTEVETIPLVSLSSQLGVNGSFALGYGTVGSAPVYLSKRETKDGGYENFTIEGPTTLYEDASGNTQPTLQVFRTYSRKSWIKNPAWTRYLMKEGYAEGWYQESLLNRIHVPPGTVMHDFKD